MREFDESQKCNGNEIRWETWVIGIVFLITGATLRAANYFFILLSVEQMQSSNFDLIRADIFVVAVWQEIQQQKQNPIRLNRVRVAETEIETH